MMTSTNGLQRYFDMYEALHQPKYVFIDFLRHEPYRIEYYWNTFSTADSGTPFATLNNASLAEDFLAVCNYGRIIVGRLLQPTAHSRVFGEQITRDESEVMLKAKRKFEELWSIVVTRIEYGGLYQTLQDASNDHSTITPTGRNPRYGWDERSTVIANGDIVSLLEDGQGRQDSAVVFEEKDEDDITNADATVAAEYNPLHINGQPQEIETFGTENDEQEIALVVNGHPYENGFNYPEEDDDVSSFTLEVDNDHREENEMSVRADVDEDTSLLPTLNNGFNEGQSAIAEGTMSDEGFELSQQHPEIAAALQMIFGLGQNILEARDAEQGQGGGSGS